MELLMPCFAIGACPLIREYSCISFVELTLYNQNYSGWLWLLSLKSSMLWKPFYQTQLYLSSFQLPCCQCEVINAHSNWTKNAFVAKTHWRTTKLYCIRFKHQLRQYNKRRNFNFKWSEKHSSYSYLFPHPYRGVWAFVSLNLPKHHSSRKCLKFAFIDGFPLTLEWSEQMLSRPECIVPLALSFDPSG